MAGLHRPKSRRNCFMNPRAIDGGTQGQVTSGKALGYSHDIGFRPIFFQCPPSAGSASATHYLIGNHQDAMMITNLARPLGITIRRGNTAACRPNHRLKDESRNVFCPFTNNRRFQFPGTNFAHCFRCSPFNWSIGIDSGNPDGIDEATFKSGSSFKKSRHAQGPQRVAMP